MASQRHPFCSEGRTEIGAKIINWAECWGKLLLLYLLPLLVHSLPCNWGEKKPNKQTNIKTEQNQTKKTKPLRKTITQISIKNILPPNDNEAYRLRISLIYFFYQQLPQQEIATVSL